jgi:hypothetical protein
MDDWGEDDEWADFAAAPTVKPSENEGNMDGKEPTVHVHGVKSHSAENNISLPEDVHRGHSHGLEESWQHQHVLNIEESPLVHGAEKNEMEKSQSSFPVVPLELSDSLAENIIETAVENAIVFDDSQQEKQNDRNENSHENGVQEVMEKIDIFNSEGPEKEEKFSNHDKLQETETEPEEIVTKGIVSLEEKKENEERQEEKSEQSEQPEEKQKEELEATRESLSNKDVTQQKLEKKEEVDDVDVFAHLRLSGEQEIEEKGKERKQEQEGQPDQLSHEKQQENENVPESLTKKTEDDDVFRHLPVEEEKLLSMNETDSNNSDQKNNENSGSNEVENENENEQKESEEQTTNEKKMEEQESQQLQEQLEKTHHELTNECYTEREQQKHEEHDLLSPEEIGVSKSAQDSPKESPSDHLLLTEEENEKKGPVVSHNEDLKEPVSGENKQPLEQLETQEEEDENEWDDFAGSPLPSTTNFDENINETIPEDIEDKPDSDSSPRQTEDETREQKEEIDEMKQDKQEEQEKSENNLTEDYISREKEIPEQGREEEEDENIEKNAESVSQAAEGGQEQVMSEADQQQQKQEEEDEWDDFAASSAVSFPSSDPANATSEQVQSGHPEQQQKEAVENSPTDERQQLQSNPVVNHLDWSSSEPLEQLQQEEDDDWAAFEAAPVIASQHSENEKKKIDEFPATEEKRGEDDDDDWNAFEGPSSSSLIHSEPQQPQNQLSSASVEFAADFGDFSSSTEPPLPKVHDEHESQFPGEIEGMEGIQRFLLQGTGQEKPLFTQVSRSISFSLCV